MKDKLILILCELYRRGQLVTEVQLKLQTAIEEELLKQLKGTK